MGKLISLKHLYVLRCYKLKYLPKGIRRLKNLKTIDVCVVGCGEDEGTTTLQLGDLKVLNLEDSEISIMPCLSSLKISDCHVLKTLPDFLCKTLVQELIIRNCSNLSERCEQGNGEEWPEISHIPNIKISS
ncbi:hypothetical protein C1H46_043450 [Malus baccata]|uniref:NB-ARC domain-containing protein n=1 Tax=Malus baccata TaxID=106549 RepID=A0A540K9W5_MALBA|nr:hypothetical protein C1H46_043450 [Malus baccata]